MYLLICSLHQHSVVPQWSYLEKLITLHNKDPYRVNYAQDESRTQRTSALAEK